MAVVANPVFGNVSALRSLLAKVLLAIFVCVSLTQATPLGSSFSVVSTCRNRDGPTRKHQFQREISEGWLSFFSLSYFF